MTRIDDYDRKIIAALQANGRLSNIDFAGLVSLSHSSCSGRIARLEREGVIVGYILWFDNNLKITDRSQMHSIFNDI